MSDSESVDRNASHRASAPDTDPIATWSTSFPAPNSAPVVAMTIADESVAGRAGPIALRRYLPPAPMTSRAPAILFFPGSSLNSVDDNRLDRACAQIVSLSGIQLVAVDYRPPTSPTLRSAVEDCIDSYSMLLAGTAEWQIDTQRIAVMGEGVGCSLATIVSIHARDMCQPIPVAQLLFDPVSHVGAANSPPGADETPLHARSPEGLPPSFIATADPLHRPSEALTRRLRAAKVATTLHCAGDLEPDGRAAANSHNALNAAVDFLHHALAESGRPARRTKA